MLVRAGARKRAGRRAQKRETIPATRMSQAERTALSDRRMLEAATALILERGTHNTTLKEIGERAGYSRGLASNRFGSKDALFNELVTVFDERVTRLLRKALGKRVGIEAFCAAVDCVAQILSTEGSYIRAMYILFYETVGSSERMRERLAGYHAGFRDDVAKWMRQGIAAGTVRANRSPEIEALQYSSFLFGLIYQWLVNPGAIDLAQALYDYRDATLESVMTSKEAAALHRRHR